MYTLLMMYKLYTIILILDIYYILLTNAIHHIFNILYYVSINYDSINVLYSISFITSKVVIYVSLYLSK